MSASTKRISRVFFAVMGLGSCALLAAPQGEMVMQGQASFHRDGAETQIVASHGSIIHYESFDIASHEIVRFIQPSNESCVLNRVFSDQTTNILGALTANGKVYIVNPNGIFFGKEAVVNATALFAIAGNFLDEHFEKGIHEFTQLSSSVINEGFIQAQNVGLFGRQVANHGRIVAGDGLVALVSGDTVLFGEKEGRLFAKVEGFSNFEDDAVGTENSGAIEAGRGNVFLGASDIYKFAIETSGLLRGKHVACESQGIVIVEGSIDASDLSSGYKGGAIEILGNTVCLENALLDASGHAGGGEIFIGGSLRGKGPLQNAQATLVNQGTSIKADAICMGDGGNVVLWSDGYTIFNGNISVQGGYESGNGGFVETSSAGQLSIEGRVIALAPNGALGNWLLDPQTIAISSVGNLYSPLTFTDPPNPGSLTLEVASINAASADILLEAELAITANSSIDITLTNTHNITMRAGGNIILYNVNTNGGSLTLSAGDSGASAPSAAAQVVVSNIDTSLASGAGNGGNVTITATGDVTVHAVRANASSDGVTGGDGGAISINSQNGSVAFAALLANSSEDGNGGNITIQSSPTMIQGPLGANDWRPVGRIIFSNASPMSPLSYIVQISSNATGSGTAGDVSLNAADRSHLPSVATIEMDQDSGTFGLVISSIRNFTVGNYETISLAGPIAISNATGTATTGDLYVSTLANDVGIAISSPWTIIKHEPNYVVDLNGMLGPKSQTIIAVGGVIGRNTTIYPNISGFNLSQAPTTTGSGADPLFYDASNVASPQLAAFTETILPDFTGFSQSGLYNSGIALTPAFVDVPPVPPTPTPTPSDQDAKIELVFAQFENISYACVPMPYMSAWKDSINRWNDALALSDAESELDVEVEEKPNHMEDMSAPLLPILEQDKPALSRPLKRQRKI